ncbi:vesicle-associated membrane protein/synaptobrevin-binding protein-like isoform X2 [Branchiostoma floridae]|uniref:Vesicle-associated membrane protein/synaptobrevin-binding protein-like isoform X2 n=1 Tax=Branchiostoma floridae TaxID=7739 RepID=A0A9J7LBI3_BRAFL|nr:vesicle-associated membrane protein/synaptobrevin-binding protein-like isoform X2 [Branchiostoma floridae]
MSKLEQVLILEPSGELKFKGPFTEVVTSNLKLNNPTDKRVCFKVKTTAPRRYCVRPNSGVVEPSSSINVSVMLQPFDYDPQEKNKHKFMVQSMFAPEGGIDNETMINMWKDADQTQLMDSKLKCVFELPPEALQALAKGKTNVFKLETSTPPPRKSVSAPSIVKRVPARPIKSVLFQNDLDAAKEAKEVAAVPPVKPNIPKPSPEAKRPVPQEATVAVKAVNVGSSASDSDMKKVLDECRRLQAEVSKLQAENAQIKDDGLRQRKATPSDNTQTFTTEFAPVEQRSAIPPVLYLLAALILGFIIGKFIL